jgi:cytochrome c
LLAWPHYACRAAADIDDDQQSRQISRASRGCAEHHVSRRKERDGKEMGRHLWIALCAAAATSLAHAQSVDVSAAEALMKKSGCLKCHSATAKKEGPPFRETAAKYKGKADAEKTLYTHLTTNPKIKVDGKEELHDNLKTKNEADVRNVVRYILSR